MRSLYALLLTIIIPFRVWSHPTHLVPRQNASSAERNVYVIGDVKPQERAVSARTGKTIFGMHTAVQIDGNDIDGPIRVQLAYHPDEGYIILARDLGVINSGKPIGVWGLDNARRYIVPIGQTSMTNVDIVDHQTGQGIAPKVWMQTPYFRRGGNISPNTSNNFTIGMLEAMGLTVDASLEPLLANSEEYYTSSSDSFAQNIGCLLSSKSTTSEDPDPGNDWQRMFDVTSSQPTIMGDSKMNGSSAITNVTLKKRDSTSPPPSWDNGVLYDDTITQDDVDGYRHSTTPLPVEKTLRTISQEDRVAVQPFDKTVGQPGSAAIGKAVELGMGRTNGVVTAFSMVAYDIAKSLGEMAGPLIVVLDLLNGNWAGAALGVVGAVLGGIASFAVAGPVGWIIGGAIAAFFAILPLAWTKTHLPSISDRQGIMQYAFFGDSTHTGNEQCQSMGNSNCTAVFGPGVLSLVFGWNNFDAITFLINYNQGYAMTLPEMASQFYNVDDPANYDGGTNQIATIKCNNKKSHANAWGSFGGDDPSYCNHPTFQLNRAAITLPILNQTADVVYNRIIPNTGGDCKLINDAANTLNVPEYSLNITGQPVAIACNLSAAEVIGGTVIPLDPVNSQTPTNISSGNSSTDGQNGHQLAVPPPTPFQQVVNSTNGVCLSGSGGSICLAAGQYDIQRGSQGFDSSKADTLTVPDGGSISWYEIGEPMPHYGPSRTKISFNVDRTPANTYFANAMASAPTEGANGAGATFNISTGAIPSPPLICLFTETDHNGDVACFGPGGGNVTDTMSGKAQSIAVKGNATAEIYAQEYGDAGSATVTSDILDLSQEIYGSDGNFDQKIVAMWVCDGDCQVS